MTRTLASRAPRVRFPLTEQLLAEATRFRLRSSCGDCEWAVGPDGEERCLHGWPNEDQRRRLDQSATLCGEGLVEVPFCKEFVLRR